jgi:hypothetical protein
MCLVRVKEEEDYSVPARVVRRDRRRSPTRTNRVSRAYYEESPRAQERTYIIQQPPPPPAPVIAYAPAENDHHSHYEPPPPPPSHPRSHAPSEHRSHAPSERHSHAGPQYVEVSPASRSSSTSSSSSSSDDRRSKATSRSKATGPQSEYHLREKEYIRERRSPHEHVPRKEDYDTYRYVQPPGSTGHRRSGNLDSRTSQIDDPRASRSSYNRRDVVIEDSHGGRTREYRQ